MTLTSLLLLLYLLLKHLFFLLFYRQLLEAIHAQLDLSLQLLPLDVFLVVPLLILDIFVSF